MSVDDECIECWVGYANVLVQNGDMNWSLCVKLGHQSWKIHRLFLRPVRWFTFQLKLSVSGPCGVSHNVISVLLLLISSISSVLSIDHENASVTFTLDSLHYPLLRGTPFQLVGHGRIFEIDKVQYREKRVRLLESKWQMIHVAMATS
ncbi:hypothetical protein BKA83DRAFT_3472805 [Pisolithus microcarpus]|nr:hypothetical protein BKA83DRAFT_3472805 [Pisolithus microcarpus]